MPVNEPTADPDAEAAPSRDGSDSVPSSTGSDLRLGGQKGVADGASGTPDAPKKLGDSELGESDTADAGGAESKSSPARPNASRLLPLLGEPPMSPKLSSGPS